MKLNTLNSEMLETGGVCEMTLKSIVDPDFSVKKFEFFGVQRLRVGEWQIPFMLKNMTN